MKINRLFIAALILGISCTPKIVDKSILSLPDRSNYNYEPFAIFEKDSLQANAYQLVGNIEIKDSGFSMQCDYETVKSLAKSKALQMGGNGFIITEHRPPNEFSTCHRIKAKVINIENPRLYETEIIWHEKRKLEILDYKGSVENRPSTVATLCSFKCQIEQTRLFGGNFAAKVEAFFSCTKSYFKDTEHSKELLQNQQVHFDISELYARKFLQRLMMEISTKDELYSKFNPIYDEVWTEMMTKQDEYSSEVTNDPSTQTKWNEWIKLELMKFDSNKTKTLKLR